MPSKFSQTKTLSFGEDSIGAEAQAAYGLGTAAVLERVSDSSK
jgi:hypothetical protein